MKEDEAHSVEIKDGNEDGQTQEEEMHQRHDATRKALIGYVINTIAMESEHGPA